MLWFMIHDKYTIIQILYLQAQLQEMLMTSLHVKKGNTCCELTLSYLQ